MKRLMILFLMLLVLASPVLGEVDYKDLVKQEIPQRTFSIQSYDEDYMDAYIRFKSPQDVSSWNNALGTMNSEDEKELKKYITEVMQDYAEVRVNYSYVHAIAGKIPKSEIKYLESFSFVEGVYENHRVELFLDDSIPLINATDVHNTQIQEQNITGSNFSVCVLDTGIDRTHPDLEGRVIAEKCFCDGCCPDGNDTVDDDGHGTHVSGIIAASGGLTGTSPGANIVSVRVITGAGGNVGNINEGIQWCNDNKEEYNITAISISLGIACTNETNCFDTFCPDTGMASNINEAVQNNISVVIATGNEENSTHISNPACVESATRVMSTTKSDQTSSFSNRAPTLNMLAAPGSQIKSLKAEETSISGCSDQGVYKICSGTSMAAPHVSGAIALLQHSRVLRGQDPFTPSELFNLLNSTGLVITDTETNTNYSRIDVHSALTQDLEEITLELNVSKDIVPFNNRTNQINWSVSSLSDLEDVNLTISYPNSSVLYYSNLTSGILNLSSENLTVLGKYNITLYGRNSDNLENELNSSFTIYDLVSVELNISRELIPFNNRTNQINWSVTNSGEIEEVNLTILNPNGTILYYSNKTNGSVNLTEENLTSYGQYNISLFANNTEGINNTVLDNFIVQKPFADINLTLNDDVENIYTNETISVNISATLLEGEELIEILVNGDVVNQSELEANYTWEITEDGSYNITARHNESENYSLTTKSLFVFFTTEVPNITSIIPDEFNVSLLRNESMQFNHTSNDSVGSDLNYSWLVNNVENATTQNFTFNKFSSTENALEVGVYNVTLLVSNHVGTTSNTWNVTISPASPIILNTSPSFNVSEKNNSFAVNFSHETVDPLNLSLNTVWFVNGENISDTWNFSFDTNDYDEGVYNISLLVNNTDGANASYYWNLTVLPENIPVNFTGDIPNFEVEKGSVLEEALNLSEYFIDEDNDTINYTLNSVTIDMEVKDNLLVNFTPDSSFSGSEIVNITAFDGYNYTTSNNFEITVYEEEDEEESTPPSSGGGGGGTTAPEVEPPSDPVVSERSSDITEKFFSLVQDSISIDTSGSLNKLTLAVSDSYSNALVRITEFEEDSDQVPFKMDSTTYKYFRIEYSTIRSESITNATFQFNIEKEWLQNKELNPEEISLYRHNNGWNEIETQLESETINTYTYKATTPGLSYFAIGQRTSPAEVTVGDIIDEEDEEEEIVHEPSAWQEYSMYVVSAIFSIITIALIMLMFEKVASKKSEKLNRDLDFEDLQSKVKKVETLVDEGEEEEARKVLKEVIQQLNELPDELSEVKMKLAKELNEAFGKTKK